MKIDIDELADVGDNIEAVLMGDKLVIVIDTTVELGLSTSGKMMATANSHMFKPFPGKLEGNLYIGKMVANK